MSAMAAKLVQTASEGKSGVCNQLLEAKANPDLQDKMSALEMAQQRLMRALC